MDRNDIATQIPGVGQGFDIWTKLGPGPAPPPPDPDTMITEDGDDMLTEDGDTMITE